MRKRKKRSEILELLFNALPVNSSLPISTIAYKADINRDTAQDYVDLIMWIQAQPKVYLDEIGEQKGYRKHTTAGRPKKE